MQKLEIQKTRETPLILFDKAADTFKISGRSLPENAFEFYRGAVEWLTAYSEEPNDSTNLEIHLEYLNSGSLKQIFALIYLVEDIMELGKEAQITWIYNEKDELMFQKGMELKNFLEVSFEMIAA